jgi:hypothetical protein
LALHKIVPPPLFGLNTMAVTENCAVFNVKVAVIVEFAFRVTAQVPTPVQLALPLHPVKVEPTSAVAVNVTGVLAGN